MYYIIDTLLQLDFTKSELEGQFSPDSSINFVEIMLLYKVNFVPRILCKIIVWKNESTVWIRGGLSC